MFTPLQCRAARAILEWSQTDLANASGVGAATVGRFESNISHPNRATRNAMKQAFEARGIEFTNGDAPGVRLPGSDGR